MPVMKPITGNLFFVGLMGAGKTTLGRHIAKTLDRSFYDSDHEICKCSGVSISTIFEVEGEQGFRNRETAMLKKLAAMKNIVLSTGGGAVLREENRICLRNNGTVIYLHARPETLLERTRHDTSRPLLQVENPLAKLRELYDSRDAVYRQTAHIVIESGNCQKTISKLLDILHNR